MSNTEWDMEDDLGASIHPFDAGEAEHVVPADGDPTVPYYQAQHDGRGASGSRYHIFWFGSPGPVQRRHSVRRWLILAALVGLGVLFFKPLLVLATVLVAVLVGIVLFGLLAAGALLLAARLTLGARYGAPEGRFGLVRLLLHRRRVQPHWFD